MKKTRKKGYQKVLPADVIDLLEEGKTPKEIAEQFHITRNRVYKINRAVFKGTLEYGTRTIDVINLINENKSTKEISEKLNVSDLFIYKLRCKLNKEEPPLSEIEKDLPVKPVIQSKSKEYKRKVRRNFITVIEKEPQKEISEPEIIKVTKQKVNPKDVIRLIQKGLSTRLIANQLNISKRHVFRVKAKTKVCGT